jgi:hypothetical protein
MVFRKVRAALVISVLWVLCWVPFGLALEHVVWRIVLGPDPWIDSPFMSVTVWVIWGALSGLCFAMVLGLGERGRAAGALSTSRFLIWGAVGSTIVPLLYSLYTFFTWPVVLAPASRFWVITLILVGASAFLGCICAALTLALMRESVSRESSGSSRAA